MNFGIMFQECSQIKQAVRDLGHTRLLEEVMCGYKTNQTNPGDWSGRVQLRETNLDRLSICVREGIFFNCTVAEGLSNLPCNSTD